MNKKFLDIVHFKENIFEEKELIKKKRNESKIKMECIISNK